MVADHGSYFVTTYRGGILTRGEKRERKEEREELVEEGE